MRVSRAVSRDVSQEPPNLREPYSWHDDYIFLTTRFPLKFLQIDYFADV